MWTKSGFSVRIKTVNTWPIDALGLTVIRHQALTMAVLSKNAPPAASVARFQDPAPEC